MTVDGLRYVFDLLTNTDTPKQSFWFALLTEQAGATATGTSIQEPIAGSYERARIDNVSGSWEISGTSLNNGVAIEFVPATEDWGMVRGWAMCTDNLDGKVIMLEMFETPVEVTAGTSVTFPIGGVSIDFEIDRWTL